MTWIAQGALDTGRWEAVLARERMCDGTFVYAVRTTGVFCRPSCPARRPRPENVEFFDSPALAVLAGYRSCRRCRPEAPDSSPAGDQVRTALAYLDQHLDEHVTLARLAEAVGLSRFHLQRLFKQEVGVSPRAYQDARRLAQMKAKLRAGEQVGSAVWGAGFGSFRGAYESAAGGLGMTPGQYRRGATGLRIEYSAHPTTFGHVLVGWTSRGVCTVLLGDTRDAVLEELRAEFPAADLTLSDTPASTEVRAVLDFLEGREATLHAPLDVNGSAFQRLVWAALRRIPLGEHRSYTEITQAIGRPGAARAVARACATNPVALVIPCHRVVRSNGEPGGYRWGVERKRQLLEHETRLRGEAK